MGFHFIIKRLSLQSVTFEVGKRQFLISIYVYIYIRHKRERKMLLLAPPPTNHDKNGNGRYVPLRRRKKKTEISEESNEFKYLKHGDPRMRFNNTKDPIYFAFEYLEKRSLPQLMGDFVKDTFFEVTNFVSKVAK